MTILLDTGPSPYGWHGLEDVLRCPRLYARKFRKEKGEKEKEKGSNPGPPLPVPATPLTKGSLVHVGLAHHYARVGAGAKTLVGEHAGKAPDDFYPWPKAMAVLAGNLGISDADLVPVVDTVGQYLKLHDVSEWGRGSAIIGVEQLHRTEIGLEGDPVLGTTERYPYTARIDLVIRDASGKVWLVDHKTTSEIRGSTRVRYTLSGQVIGLQYLGAVTYGKLFGGVVINLIQHVGDGIHRARALAKFERITPEPAPGMLRDFPRVVVTARRRIATYADRPLEQWPPIPSEHTCMTAYGACQFFDACRWGT